jgi:hypothetical protein
LPYVFRLPVCAGTIMPSFGHIRSNPFNIDRILPCRVGAGAGRWGQLHCMVAAPYRTEAQAEKLLKTKQIKIHYQHAW